MALCEVIEYKPVLGRLLFPLVWHEPLEDESCAAAVVASVALGNNNEGLVLEVASFSSLQKRTRTYRKPRKLLNFSEHANKMSDVMRNFEGSIG